VRHTEATLRSYRTISADVDRAITRSGYDGRVLRAKFEAMAHEAEMELYALRNQRLLALRLALRYRDPEFLGSAVRRVFRVLSVILSVLMPRGVYVSLRAWYRSTRLFDALHPRPDTTTRPTAGRRPD
jgi:hypothetical protein